MGVKCNLSLVNTGSGGFAVSSLARSAAHYSQVRTWPKMWNGKRISLAFRERLRPRHIQQKESTLIIRQLVGPPLASCRDVSSFGLAASMRHKNT